MSVPTLFPQRFAIASGIVALIVLFAAASAANAQLPDKPLKPPLPSDVEPGPPPADDKDPITPPRESVEEKRLKSARDPASDPDVLPPPDGDADETAKYNGSVAAVDLKDREVQVKLDEEEFFSFLIDDKTKIIIDAKPGKLADVKAEDPVIVTTLKDDTAEKVVALKLEVVRVKRTSVPSEQPPAVPRNDEPPIRQLEHAVALGAICVPTPCESVLVVAIDRDSPAERAGIRTGDFITQINGEEPQDILLRGDLVYFVKEAKSGLACNIVVWRAGKEYAAELVVVDVDVVPKALPPVVVEERVKTVIVDDGKPRDRVDVDVEGVIVDDLPDIERRALAIDTDADTKALIAELLAELRRLRAEGSGIKPKP